MDEPCSALDPIATARIEDLMTEIKQKYTIVIVTHNMQQAARVSDRTAFFTTEINLHLPALMPNSYCGDVHERLVVYKRLANCDDLNHLESMQEELVDRFGDLHPAVRTLIEVHRLRIRSRDLGIKRLDAGPEIIQIQFVKHPPIDPETIIGLIRKQRGWRMSGPDKLRIERVSATLEDRSRACREILALFSQPPTPHPTAKAAKAAKTH